MARAAALPSSVVMVRPSWPTQGLPFWRAMWPLMNVDDLVGASWLPTDGQASPSDITQSLAIVSGSNPNLTEETSDSYTYGVVIQPRFSASRFWPVSLKHRCTWTSTIPFCIKALLTLCMPSMTRPALSRMMG